MAATPNPPPNRLCDPSELGILVAGPTGYHPYSLAKSVSGIGTGVAHMRMTAVAAVRKDDESRSGAQEESWTGRGLRLHAHTVIRPIGRLIHGFQIQSL